MPADQTVARLVAACPSFPRELLAPLAELGPYALLSELAHQLVDLLRDGNDDEVRAVLAIAEETFASGSPDEVTVARNGLLEALQNIVSHDDVPVSGEAFLPLLGPRCSTEWHELNETWLLAAAARPDGGAVSLEQYRAVRDPDVRRHLQTNRRALLDGRIIGISDVLAYEQAQAAGVRAATLRLRRVTAVAVIVCLALLCASMLLNGSVW